MTNIQHLDSVFKRVKSVIVFLDKLNLRAAYGLDGKILGDLQNNADYVRPVLSKHAIYHGGRWSRLTYRIVNPNDTALKIIANLPLEYFKLNGAELAIDLVVDEADTAIQGRDLCDRSFVQGWHRQPTRYWEHGTSTGICKRFFTWYADKPSKRSGDPHILHLEARLIGSRVLQANGIDQQDLINFDHASFWARNLNFYEFDPQRLGMFLDNQARGCKRRQPKIQYLNGRIPYDFDSRHGHLAFRVANYSRMTDPEHDPLSVQHLVDDLGRGPFLHRIETHLLMSMLQNPSNNFNYLNPRQKTPISLNSRIAA